MVEKHIYRFEVEVTHIGPVKDFDYFFHPRRNKAEYKPATLIKHEEVPLSEAEKRPKLCEKMVKALLTNSIKKAEFNLVKYRQSYDKPSECLALGKYNYTGSPGFVVQTPRTWHRLYFRYDHANPINLSVYNSNNIRQKTILVPSPNASDEIAELLRKAFKKNEATENTPF